MRLQALPELVRLHWRRIDVPGSERARIERVVAGWRLSGELEVREPERSARLRYAIECDSAWIARSAAVEGEADGARLSFALEHDGEGHWVCNGAARPELTGALDLDFGFTPATNLLPIRRLELGLGAQAAVRSAWLRFPELRLEPLGQSYAREAERAFRYRSQVDGAEFSALLEVDACGCVLRYEGLWEALSPEAD